MKRLIVNGDDFGRNRSVNLGVTQAFDMGILTSASLVANSLDFDFAISAGRVHPDLGVGVHLVLDEYAPISAQSEIPSLLDARGRFFSRSSMLLKILTGRIDRRHVATEWRAQIAKIVDAGISPAHVDGHGHCHAYPGLAEIVVELAAKFGIRAIRLPREPLAHLGSGGAALAGRYLGKAALNASAHLLRSKCRSRIHCPDAFFGFMEGGRLTGSGLEKICRSLRPGVSELMAHPALDNADAPYGCGYQWRGDLDALLCHTKRSFEDAFDVKLVSYRNGWIDD